MEYMHMNFHDKRFHSKASSASCLSPNNLAFSTMKDSPFWLVTIVNSLLGEEGKGEGKNQDYCNLGIKVI